MGLYRRGNTKAFVKVYIEEDEEAENIINLGKEAGFNIYLNKLKAEDWENGWKKYYSTFNNIIQDRDKKFVIFGGNTYGKIQTCW